MNLLEDLPGSSDDILLHVCDILIEFAHSEVPLKDVPENGTHCVFIKVGESYDIEMSLESWSDERFTTSWRSHGSDDTGVDDVSERMLVVFSFIPSSLIDKLSENLNRWLSTENLFGHIEIINENDTSHSKSGTEVILSSLVKFHIDDILDLVTSSLSGETDLNDQPLISWKFIGKDILNVSGLSCTSWSNEKRLDVILNEKFLHESILDGIGGSDDDFLYDGALWEVIELVFVGEIDPGFPFVGLWDKTVIINGTSIEISWKDFVLELWNSIDFTIADLFEVVTEASSVLSVNRNTERPDCREQEGLFNELLNFLFIHLSKLLSSCLILKDFEHDSEDS